MEEDLCTFSLSKQMLIVGSITRLDLSINIGKKGIPRDGLVRIEFPWGCWTPPIMAEIKVHAYLQNVNAKIIVIANDKNVELIPRVWYRGVLNPFVILRVTKGNLIEGDKIIFQYGIVNRQLPESRCQLYPIDSVEFKVSINPDGNEYGKWLKCDKKGKLRIVPRGPERLELILPSIAGKDEKLKPRYVFTDKYRNEPNQSYEGKLTYEIVQGESQISNKEPYVSEEVIIKPKSPGILRFGIRGNNLLTADKTIIPMANDSSLDYLPIPRRKGNNTVIPLFQLPKNWINKDRHFNSFSNPVRVLESAPKYRIYWGDLHVHTTFSDGALDIDNAYHYARDIVKLDIMAVTDHDVGFDLSGMSSASKRQAHRWKKTQQAANSYYEPGKFVTFRGFEWTSNNFGHRNIYFPGAEIEDYIATLDSDYSLYEMKPSHYYKIIGSRKSIIIPHHTLVATEWDYYDPREHLVEIYSTWGRTEYSGNIGWDKPDNPKGGALEGLKRGYRFGFIGGSDAHDSCGGKCYPSPPALNLNYRSGLMAVFAEELTRESIYEALKARRTYATTGERIYLNFIVDGALMGSEIEKKQGQTIEGSIEAFGTRPFRSVELIQDGIVIKTIITDSDSVNYSWNITVPAHGKSLFIYVRVEQVDGNMAWSSPIWVTGK